MPSYVGISPFRTSYKIPVDWLEDRFREIGLDVYIHNYSFMYPEKLLRGQVSVHISLFHPFPRGTKFVPVLISYSFQFTHQK